MNQATYNNYLLILKEELIPAMGCTEPIAIAYASAKAAELLSVPAEYMEVWCSGNVIKNVMGVTVPCSNGLKGIEAAAILGLVGGDPKLSLEVLTTVTSEDIATTNELLRRGFCSCHLVEDVENLFIIVKLFGGKHKSEVEITEKHTNITRLVRDGQDIFSSEFAIEGSTVTIKGDRSLLNVRDILEFAAEVEIDDIHAILSRQIEMNTAISREGLMNRYGAQIGRTLINVYGNDDTSNRARAWASAGSDARMSGCPMPVVINSGSGNQGLTASLPVIVFAEALQSSRDNLLRALCISNLISLHQKKYIGSLSAYCGVVSAATGAGAAITWLHGGDYNAVARTITNTIANVGGIVCDGAKASCAAKIASSVDAAILAHHMSMDGQVFCNGEGLVQEDVEHTIRNFGRVGKIGMASTDKEILSIMIKR